MIGIILGILSGLVPGLHSNTVISVLSALGIDDNALSVIIITLIPANLVTSFIPALFFGIPEAGTVVAMLPGHRMAKEGMGLVALKTILMSCVFAALASVALFHVSLDVFPIVFGLISPHMGLILPALTVVLLIRGRHPARSAIAFLMAAIIGYFALGSSAPDPFLPLFTGLFAIPAIIIYRNGSVKDQDDGEPGFGFRFVAAGVVLGFLSDLIPGIGSPSQVAAFLAIVMRMNSLSFLSAVSSISVSQSIFSYATSSSIGRSRNGGTEALASLMDIENNMVLILALTAFSLAVTVSLIYVFRKKIALLSSLDFSGFNIILGIYLVAISFVIDGPWGIAVLVAASIIGYLAIRMDVERVTLMGAIIGPTILYFI